MSETEARTDQKLNIKHPTDSFSSFTRMTQQLQAAYRELENRFETLNQKLQETNIELRQSLGEKDRISSYLTNILENLNSGVVVLDTGGRVRLFNRAAQKILKLDENSVLGAKWAEINSGTGYSPGCRDTLEKKVVYSNEEKTIADAHGNLMQVGFSTSLLRAPDDEVLGAIEVFYDLTKIKRLEKEMRRVSTLAALGKMAATIAHEVRNPLGAIAGFTSLLDKDTPEDDPRRKLINKISGGIDSLNRVVNGLLEFTREPQLRFHDVPLDDFVTDVIANISFDLDKKNITLETDIQDEIGTYPLDKDHFQRILINLIQNAVQASHEGGKIKIALSRNDKQLSIAVEDRGKGMTAEQIGNIFEPFFTTREKGTGLGLAIVKKLVQAHGGSIFAESPGENQGARFVITLPAEVS
ncbi:MAG: PAS domain-containing protein [candidate division Zixibacteria bacterium]|nr:PAS domain-containing protein [candidate division Zixibacteria bacterium]